MPIAEDRRRAGRSSERAATMQQVATEIQAVKNMRKIGVMSGVKRGSNPYAAPNSKRACSQ
jgi:hypothetical protein